MNEIEIARILIALGGTAAATYYDVFNRKNVPEMLLYAFLALALVINVLDYSTFVARLPIAVLIVGFLYLMYRIGQLGGADIFVLAAIYAAIPVIQTPLLMQPPIQDFFGLPSMFPILSISVFLFSIVMILKHMPSAINKTLKGKVKFNTSQIAQAMILFVAYFFVVYLLLESPLKLSLQTTVFIVFVMLLVLFFVLYKDFITAGMIKWKAGRAVEMEDVIALEALDPKLVSKYRLNRLVDSKQLKAMMKLGRKWPVLDLPMFLPYVLIALAIYILIGDPLLYSF